MPNWVSLDLSLKVSGLSFCQFYELTWKVIPMYKGLRKMFLQIRWWVSFICCKGLEWRPSRFKLSFWWVAKTWWSASNGFWTAGDLICEDMISTTGPFIAPSRACLTVRFTFFLRYEIEIQLILSLHPFCPSSCWDRWHNGDFFWWCQKVNQCGLKESRE